MNRLIYASAENANMRYAVKIDLTGSFFWLQKGKQKFVFLDRRDFGYFREKNRYKNLKPVLIEELVKSLKKKKSKTSFSKRLALLLLQKNSLIGKPIEVPADFPLALADYLRRRGAKLIPVSDFFPERAVKSPEEVEIFQNNIRQTEKAFAKIEKILRASKIKNNRLVFDGKTLTSEFLKQEAEKTLIENGMSDALGMILSSGKDTAIPHHLGSGPIRPHSPIICDIFPKNRQNGYFADMTRTFCKGKPIPELENMYSAVLAAQKAAFSKIKHGAKVKEVCRAVADEILQRGFHVGDRGLTHGIGHGVGLDIHEAPSLKMDSDDMLQAGNVITIEPGLYYPEIGGVRLEDLILVTKKGYLNLNKYPKRLVIP